MRPKLYFFVAIKDSAKSGTNLTPLITLKDHLHGKDSDFIYWVENYVISHTFQQDNNPKHTANTPVV